MLDKAPSPIEDPVPTKPETAIHQIRVRENEIFEKWIKNRYPFSTDGCADPKSFEQSRYKIVFALKERNYNAEEQSSLAEAPYDLSKRLTTLREDTERETFGDWWTLMAKWAEVLLGTDSMDWSAIERSFVQNAVPEDDKDCLTLAEKNKKSLGRCACMQLKKTPGGGTLNKAKFKDVVKEDKKFILQQFAIYSPHFIVSCGSNDNWNVFLSTIFPKSEVKRTRYGIEYFIASSPEHGLCKTAVVNFCHPKMRLNSSLWGVLAFGLREALDEINLAYQDLGV